MECLDDVVGGKNMKKTRTISFGAIALLSAPGVSTQLAAQTAHHHYKLIEIPTLGGPQSFVNGGGGLTQILDNQGTFTGCADTSIPDLNFPNSNPQAAPPDPLIYHAIQWKNDVLTDLGALPGASSSCSFWISENGLIAGVSETNVIDPFLGWPAARAVLWKEGKIIDLGTLGGNESFVVGGVNDRGQVVGSATNAIPDPFSGYGTQLRGFLWQKGVMQDLGTLGGPDVLTTAVNNRGQIVGYGSTNSILNPITGGLTTDPFLWEDGKMIDLGTLGGTFGGAGLINNQGQIAGQSNLAGDLVTRGFFWDRGVLTDLGSFGGDVVEVFWLNELGEVFGTAEYPGNVTRHAFRWKKGDMTDLGTLYAECSSDVTGSTAYGANSKSQVVGSSWCDDLAAAAFLWEDGEPMVDLNALITPASNIQLVFGLTINDGEEIAGVGFLPNGDSRDFVLIPCDENHPNIEGCDYNLAEGSTVASARKQAASNPSLPPDAIGRLMRSLHLRSAPWQRRLGAQSPK